MHLTWIEIILEIINNLFSGLKNIVFVLGALGSFFAALVALYLGDWKVRLNKPKLKIFFKEQKPYLSHKIAFEPSTNVNLSGKQTSIPRPGFNARVKIFNDGKTTAKKVQARIEKIKFYNNSGEMVDIKYYHPTAVKWSGEKSWLPVDIVPYSFFFLDVFWSVNERSEEVLTFFNENSEIKLNENAWRQITQNQFHPSEKIFWNVWVDTSYKRGIYSEYDFQGKIEIYFIVNSENSNTIRFEAIIEWSFDKWSNPNIKIKHNNKFINYDNEEKFND